MQSAGWYIMAYDIADPRRLAKVHRRMKKEGIPAQKSVFFIHGNEMLISGLMDRIAELMEPKEDDLRAYPITCPADVWTNGPNPIAEIPAVYFGNEKRVALPVRKKSEAKKYGPRWLRKLLKKI